MLRRLIGFVILVLGVVGLALCIAGIVGLWRIKPELTARTTDLTGKANRLLAESVKGLRDVEGLLQRARQSLEQFHETAKKTPPAAQPVGMKSTLLKMLLGEYTPQVNDAQRTLNTALDAAVVINTILEGVPDVPMVRLDPVDTDKLSDLKGELDGLITKGQKLNAFLLTQDGETPSAEALGTTVEIEDALTRITTKLQGLSERVGRAKTQVELVHNDLPGWIAMAVVVLTVVLVWIGLGQLSLAAHGWSWLVHRSRRIESV